MPTPFRAEAAEGEGAYTVRTAWGDRAAAVRIDFGFDIAADTDNFDLFDFDNPADIDRSADFARFVIREVQGCCNRYSFSSSG